MTRRLSAPDCGERYCTTTHLRRLRTPPRNGQSTNDRSGHPHSGDRALYLPKEWTDDRKRLKAAHVPVGVGFATKPQIARAMIARAIAAKVPFAFVAADSVHGTGEIETMLRKAGRGYVLGVASNHVFDAWGKKLFAGGSAADIAQSLPRSAWRRRSAGEGTKGPRLHDWTYLELADLDAGEYSDTLTAHGRAAC